MPGASPVPSTIRAGLSHLRLHGLGGTAGYQVRRDIRVGQTAPDRRAEQVWFGLVDAAHHHAHPFEGGLHGVRLTDVEPAAARTVPQFDRELRGLFGAAARHDDTAWVVRREIRCNAASHGPIAANDQDVFQYRQHRFRVRRPLSRGGESLLPRR